MALTRPRAYQIYDIDYKQAVRVVTLTNITLSGGAPNSVDGVNLSLNDRILVVGQNNPVQNGIYYVTTVGSGSNGTWARSVDTDTTGELLSGTIVMVTEGTTYADTQWKLITNDPITIGVTSLSFVQNYLANSISNGGTSFSVGSANANATISVSSVGNIAVFSPDSVTFTGNLLPTSNVTYSLGSTNQRWKDLWISNSTIYLGNVTLGATGTQLTVSGANVVTSTDSGNISGSGNITGGNLITTGNAIVGNILTDGYYYANGAAFAGGGGGGTPGGIDTQVQFNDNGVFGGTGGFTFNKTTNAITTSGTFSATGNITGSYIIGNGSQLTGLPAGYTDANVSSLLAAFGSNTISTTGTITAGNIAGSNLLTNGLISASGNITSAANIAGGNLLTTGLISATSTITGTSFLGTLVSVSGNITSAANVAGGNVLATTTVSAASHIGATVSITGTMTAASTVGGVITGTSISTTGNITSAANIAGGNVLATTIVSAASHIGATVSITGTMTAASTVGGVITGSSSSVTGTVTGATVVSTGTISTAGNIVSTAANATANIGSATTYFNTVHAKATSAQYADVAEYYASDANYEPGTVVSFGGDKEVTICYRIGDDSVAGVVSTNPAYIMNAGINSTYSVPVALTGRVPTKVLGPVRKGNMMISAGNGYAQACSTPAIGTVIGKAIENFDGQTGVIEIVVGRV